MTGEFITDSLARGCFILLQCNRHTMDRFRAIPRNGSEHDVFELITVDSSTYTIYAYDLEDNALPYPMPANTPNHQITINTSCKYHTVHVHVYTIYIYTDTPIGNPSSKFLKNASISQDGSNVTVYCELVDNYPTASCVLVYREYSNTTLNVEVFTSSFPESGIINGSVIIDDPGKNYTFAVFGRNSSTDIDIEPLTSIRVMFDTIDTIDTPTSVIPLPSETLKPTPTPPTPGTVYMYTSLTLSYVLSLGEDTTSSAAVVAAVVSVMTVVMLIMTLQILLLVVYWRYKVCFTTC